MRARLGILGEPKAFFLVKTLKLKDANMVSTPGEDPKKEREQEASQLLEGDKITANRQLAARANCMAPGPAGHTICGERIVHGDGNANSGSMEAFEKIGAMCSSASKKERASWLGGLPPNGRSTSGGGREALWRLHWLDPTRSRLEKTIGWALWTLPQQLELPIEKEMENSTT